MFQNPWRGRQARNFYNKCSEILDLKSSSEQIFSKNWRWMPLTSTPCLYKMWWLSCLVPRRHSLVTRVSHSTLCENRSGCCCCRTKLKLPYQIDSEAALLPYLIHQLGSAHEWSGVWTGPYLSRSCITNGGITNTGSGSNTRVKVVSKTAWKQKQKRKNKTRHNKKRWLNRCLFVRSVLHSWLSKERRAKLAWGNSRHLATLLLVSPRNDVWETSAEIPYWWRITTQIWVVLVVGCAAWKIFLQPISSTTQNWVVTRSQYGISHSFLGRHFMGKPVGPSGSVAKCRLFSQANAKQVEIQNHSLAQPLHPGWDIRPQSSVNLVLSFGLRFVPCSK